MGCRKTFTTGGGVFVLRYPLHPIMQVVSHFNADCNFRTAEQPYYQTDDVCWAALSTMTSDMTNGGWEFRLAGYTLADHSACLF